MQPSVFTGKSSQGSQVNLPTREGIQQGLTAMSEEDLKRYSRGSASFPGKTMNSRKESERYLMRPSKSDSGSCLPRGPDKKHLEKILKAHLGRKLEQIKQGLIPVCAPILAFCQA